ncbi:MAG: helix-turn-helix transcriptional regulator [Clostridia bacterium]|nr:helix-turn-helix transcriptional regulator [Clostridia bacterium]
MKLQEKIYYCRKKAGLSQDGLAEKLEVSRQAVSKWENGEAMPETAKLPALAKVFGVSIDWLLSEEDPPESIPLKEEVKNTPGTEKKTGDAAYGSSADEWEEKFGKQETDTAWMDRLPGLLGKLVKRWGWLSGVYVSVVGAGMAGIGGLAKLMSSLMINSFTSSVDSMTTGMFPGGGVQITDSYGNPVEGEMADAILEAIGPSMGTSSFDNVFGAQTQMLQNNPVDIMANVLIILGLLTVIGGIVLAVWLRKWGAEK